MGSRARIVTNPDGTFEVYSDYDAEFVARLKDLVPADDREWDKEEKVWRVGDPDLYPDVVSLCEERYANVVEQ